ncbi:MULTISPECIES: ABC transporter substrate-binding protein [Nocardiaceae]|uniref:ABC-type nitrate/sulfonate/bicarbonate transport system substrate-binding protein n=1 Tax=Rhodococcoides corynebacterioides TaxID=53972 RepID=A0ABS2KMT1_9NOCA|nr:MULTISPECIES: hypothetical protein [Rhodococcus]MBM7413269.1 ABC-type nitrate/sulfonate/bicarbonate transport system substrate-binding protein [Rhodococcus corynebacterioides]MBP1115732.1 ABC-type nitrate/sulfonate/bicarbonate transport system substrate-binding protein [Rhodococcus sp. PvP016]
MNLSPARAARVIALSTVIGVLLSACGGNGDASSGVTVDENGRLSEPTTITMTSPCQTVSCFPPFLFNEWDEFEKRNITIENTVLPTTDATALAATGNIDVYQGGMSVGLLNAIASGADVRVAAPTYQLLDENEAGFYVSTRLLEGRTFDPSMLKGQTIASSQGNAGATMIALTRLLKEGGLSIDDVDITMMTEADQIPALENGSIFMATLNEPSTFQINKSGGGVKVGRQVVSGFPISVYVFGRNLISGNAAVGEAFTAALRAVYVNRLQGDYIADPTMRAEMEKALGLAPGALDAAKSDLYPTDLAFPDGWVEAHTQTWSQIPDLLQGESGDLTNDDVIDRRFMDFANGITP